MREPTCLAVDVSSPWGTAVVQAVVQQGEPAASLLATRMTA